MVCLHQMLSCNIDNKRANKPTSLKEAKTQLDWLEWQMAIQRKYDSLIENGT